MAKVIALANQKGGAGKSTVTALLANHFSQDHNYRVLVVDCDLQSSIHHMRALQLTRYSNHELTFDVDRCYLSKLESYCRENFNKYDLIFVDIPGMLYSPDGSYDNIVRFLFICDLVLIPIKPSYFDYDSSMVFLKMLREIELTKTAAGFSMEVATFVNQATKSNETTELVKNLSSKTKMLKSRLSLLTEYSRLSSGVKSVQKSSVSNPKLKREFGEFAEEVYKLIQSLD